MADSSKRSRHNGLGTFIVRVQQNQNSTFQGKITWVEEDKTSYFRSMWEMVRLIEDGLVDAGEAEQCELPDWK